MGAGVCTIRFKEQLPSFIQIQSTFHDLTGLKLELNAELQIQKLTHSNGDIFSLLAKDADVVARIEKERQYFFDSHPQEYELLAEYRDNVNKKLSQLIRITNVRFAIYDFYEIDFSIQGNEIALYTWVGQEYVLNNLIRVLIELGGKFYDGDNEKDNSYPEKWKRYKKWQQYKWYNRPRK